MRGFERWTEQIRCRSICTQTFSVDVMHSFDVRKRPEADHSSGVNDGRDVMSCYS